MTRPNLSHTLVAGLVVAASLALACAPGEGSSSVAQQAAAPAATAPAAPATTPPSGAALAVSRTAATPAASTAVSGDPGAPTFTGTRDETERFIGYYQAIQLTPEQERIKVEALSTIPAPCCADNPLATCCCPCNMAKAAWGLAAWMIAEHGAGVDDVRAAAKDWLAAANPGGFTGNACYSGGCGRAIHDNGCGGMDDRHVL